MDDSILAYMQSKAMKMTLENMSFDYRRRILPSEGTLEENLTLSSLEGVNLSQVTFDSSQCDDFIELCNYLTS